MTGMETLQAKPLVRQPPEARLTLLGGHLPLPDYQGCRRSPFSRGPRAPQSLAINCLLDRGEVTTQRRLGFPGAADMDSIPLD